MTKIRFEDLPSTNTPINAENLNKLNNVIVSSEEPTTGEEVWIQKGNNLIDLSLFETKIVNDVTFTNNGNGTITINGTANGAFGISLIKLHLKAGNYSFNSNSNENMYLYDYDTNTNILSSGGNATFNQDYNNVGLDMYIEQGTVFSNVLVSPMLNMGSQLPFEKYIDKKIYVQNDNGYEEFTTINSGKIANGTYIKFPDGTLIQRGVVNTGSQSQYTINFPIPFIDIDYSFSAIAQYNASNDATVTYSGTLTNSINVFPVVNGTTPIGDVQNIMWTAIGRWK